TFRLRPRNRVPTGVLQTVRMSSYKSTRWWMGWKGLALLAVLVAAGWGIKARWFTKPPAPQVITAEVKTADLEDTVLASGTIEAIKQVSVGAQVSGQVKKLYVTLGEQIKQGQPIADI